MATAHSGSSSQITLSHVTEAQNGNPTPLVLALRALLLMVLKKQAVPEAIAEDLAQKHTLPLMERFCRGGVREGNWSRYTRRTAVRLAATYHKRASREELVGDAPWWGDTTESPRSDLTLALRGSDAPTAEELLLQGELQAQVRRALALIPPADRLLLTQIYFQDIPLTALLAGGTRDALYKRHERAKSRLLEALERLIEA